MSAQNEKIALFIDGANLYATAKSLGFDIDYKRLLREFQSRGYLVRAFYYTAVIEDQEYSSIRPLIDWLDYNGYTVVTKATKEFVDQTGRRKVKGNMDIELAVDAMELAPHIDQMVLFSGDGDFRSLVEAVQRRGVRVIVVSTISTQPPMVADELRRQADQFVDIIDMQNKIGRDPGERPAREPREPANRASRATPRNSSSAARPRSASKSKTSSKTNSGRMTDAKDGRQAANERPAGPRLSALSPSRRLSTRLARPRAGMVQCPGRLVRTARCPFVDCRARARTAWRQPHRAAVHRRLCRRSALRHFARIRLCARQVLKPGPTTGWNCSTAVSSTPCAACRRRTSRRLRRSKPAANS